MTEMLKYERYQTEEGQFVVARVATEAEVRHAAELLATDPETTFRSCWLCNTGHAHFLDRPDCILKCEWCDRVFAGGVDVTGTDILADGAG